MINIGKHPNNNYNCLIKTNTQISLAMTNDIKVKGARRSFTTNKITAIKLRLIIPNNNRFFVRFYPGKNDNKTMGHIHKIIAGLNNSAPSNRLLQLPPAQVYNITSSGINIDANLPTNTSHKNTEIFYVNEEGLVHNRLPLQNHPVQYINKSGKSYITTIDKETTVFDIKKADLLRELKNREFTKPDDHTQSSLLDTNGNKITIGETFNNVKITPHAQAYLNKVFSPNMVKPNTSLNNSFDYIIAPLSPNAEICLIKTGTHNHVYFAIKDGNYFYSSGYLTGANYGSFLHDKKFDIYQKEQEDPQYKGSILVTKKQNVTEFGNLIRIPEEEVVILKYGSKYIEYIQQKVYFKQRFQDLKNKPIMEYDSRGITRQRALDICLQHDENIKNKLPHPKTFYQIQQEENKKKNQSTNKDVKKDKQLINKVNEFNDE